MFRSMAMAMAMANDNRSLSKEFRHALLHLHGDHQPHFNFGCPGRESKVRTGLRAHELALGCVERDACR